MIAAVLIAGAFLEPGFDVATWRSEDGLPSDAVIALAQTPDGYLWVGTNAGLARFDGVRFTVFDRRNAPELQSDQCGPLLVDGKGALWIGTMGGGLTRYQDGKFTTFGRAEGSTYEYIISMLLDRDGSLWLGTDDRPHHFDGTRFRSFGPDDGMTITRPQPLLQDASGAVWLMGDRGRMAVFRNGALREESGAGAIVPAGLDRPARPIPGRSGTTWLVQANPATLTRWVGGSLQPVEFGPIAPRDAISRVVEVAPDELWVGLREGGLRHVDAKGVVVIGPEQGLPPAPVAAVLEDKEHDVWVASNAGLARIRRKSFAALTDPATGGAERTWAVIEDRRGDLWIGTDLYLWRLHEGRMFRYGLQEGLPSLGAIAFAEDRDGTLWVGTPGGPARFDGARFVPTGPDDGLVNRNVRALFVDRDGRLWAGTTGGAAVLEGGRFRTYTAADGLAGDWVRFIAEDRSGAMWFATTSGVSRLHNGRFTTFRTKDGLADDRVLAIHEDESGALWFGTYRGGLTRLKGGRFVTISRAQGLHDDTILRILDDGAGSFWMSTPHGVFRAARKELDDVADGRARTLTSVAYDKSDGLPTPDCGGGTQPAGWRARDGRMWFPTGRGVAVVDPKRLRANAVPPAVRVEEVLYDRVHPGGPAAATLPPGTKSLELHYTATALGSPQRARFRYRLEPFDADWIDAGTRRVAYYTALRPGRYRFRVAAANESGVWSEAGANYDVRVQPYVYETVPFFVACASALALAGWGAYRLRVRQIEARWAAVLAERGRIARELHDTVAQGFTGVSMQLEAVSARLGEEGGGAREHLDRARAVVRDSLADARRSVRALRPQLLESQDLGASLRAVLAQLTAGTDVLGSIELRGAARRFPPDVEDVLFRVGQEAMTNAVRHGRCRRLDVTLAVADGAATLTIADDGAGFDASAVVSGSGLSGMRERVARIGGTLSIDAAPSRGARISAAVPLRPAREEGRA